MTAYATFHILVTVFSHKEPLTYAFPYFVLFFIESKRQSIKVAHFTYSMRDSCILQICTALRGWWWLMVFCQHSLTEKFPSPSHPATLANNASNESRFVRRALKSRLKPLDNWRIFSRLLNPLNLLLQKLNKKTTTKKNNSSNTLNWMKRTVRSFQTKKKVL